MRRVISVTALTLAMGVGACGGGNTPPQGGTTAPGADRQGKGPVETLSIYLDGFHAAKDDPAMQMEAHHYCNQVNEDFAQCVLFDGNTADARMVGVEYIVSEQIYNTLPADEKAYWHPHNFEILSGQLRLPDLPDVAEKEALKGKMNSYGKTWHFWMTGMRDHQPDPLPFGPPRLQWSFNHDGEDLPGMVEDRDTRMHLNTAEARKNRRDMVSLAKPQGGVDAMAGQFPHSKPMSGVTDNGDASTRAIPTFGMKNGQQKPTAGIP